MKKLTFIIAFLLVAVVGFAQDTQAPNRLLINDTSYGYHGFVIDHVSDLSFDYIAGEVSVSAEIEDVATDKLIVSIHRSEACYGYKIDIIPSSYLSWFSSDVDYINYVNDDSETSTYYMDFTSAELTGIDLKYGTDYALVLVALDMYGIDCTVTVVPFTTPAATIVGNPYVEAEVISSTTTSFTMQFTPNEDVSTYYIVAGEKGSMESQYEFWGPMMGFSSFSEMIEMWGYSESGPAVETWTDMAAGTEYEVLVAMKDINGNFADYLTYYASTQSLGGSGDAYVDVSADDYVLINWGGEMVPCQYLTFTPNDQTAMYRFAVYYAYSYDANVDYCKEDLCQDPPYDNVANWFYYDPYTTYYNIDPNTECVAIAAGKNIDGVWGEVNEYRFTTPSEATSTAAAPKLINKIGQTFVPQRNTFQKGKIPTLTKSSKIQLNVKE